MTYVCIKRLVNPAVIAASLLLLLATFFLAEEPPSFRDQQWKYPRVRTASKEKDEVLRQRFKEKSLNYPPSRILLRAFKKEGVLELWADDAEEKPYILVHEYRICISSGVLGPKRRFGDEQVPEGFYELDWFNPQSNFFLSLHISYPNASDRILGSQSNPGGDIFLHGNCASIGCIPITDDGIKEVYWLAVLVHGNGQQHLPIQIFPARLSSEGLQELTATHRNDAALLAFWSNLKEGYDLFEKSRRLQRVKTRADGVYLFY
jgi:murein L,D-transpeptidase YafK